MTNRTLEIKVRFTHNELSSLNKKVKRTGMSREGYVRTLCNNKTPVELPPADYHALIREVRALGNNLHQIAYKANSQGKTYPNSENKLRSRHKRQLIMPSGPPIP